MERRELEKKLFLISSKREIPSPNAKQLVLLYPKNAFKCKMGFGVSNWGETYGDVGLEMHRTLFGCFFTSTEYQYTFENSCFRISIALIQIYMKREKLNK